MHSPCFALQSWTWDNSSAVPLLRRHALLPLKLLEAMLESNIIEMAGFLSAGLGTNEPKLLRGSWGWQSESYTNSVLTGWLIQALKCQSQPHSSLLPNLLHPVAHFFLLFDIPLLSVFLVTFQTQKTKPNPIYDYNKHKTLGLKVLLRLCHTTMIK